MSWLTHLRNLVTPSRARNVRRKPTPRRSSFRPLCEALEDRLVPAVGDLLTTINTPLQSTNDQSGRAIAGSDELIVIGTPNGFTPSGVPGQFLRNGAVHVYDQTGAFLYSLGDPQTLFTEFGSAVSMVGSNILVGAPRAGRAYLFDGLSGNYLQTFINPVPGGGGFFGCSVAAVGNNVLIGAKLDSLGSGAAYLFDSETGALLQTFLNPTPAFYNLAGIGGDQFGSSVTAYGDNVLIGAPLDDTRAIDSGAAYLFDSTTGALLRTILNPTPASGDRFGSTLTAVAGNIVIGAQFDDAGALDTGAVHIFNGVNGTLLRTISNPSPGANEEFGCSVAAVGSNLMVGSLGDRFPTIPNLVAGGAYLFDGQNFSLLHRFVNPTPKADDQFGYSVAAAGHNILIGAPLDDISGFNNNGVVHLYDGATYRMPVGNGADDVTLTVDPLGTWTLIDENTGEQLAQGTQTQSVILVGADDEDDTVTVNVWPFGRIPPPPAAKVNISFDGGYGGNDTLTVLGAGFSTRYSYYPSASSEAGSLRTDNTDTDNRLTTFISFAGVESTDLSHARSVTLIAPSRSIEDMQIDTAISLAGDAANVILGLVGSTEMTPLTFSRIETVGLYLGLDDPRAIANRLSVSDGGLVADGLKTFAYFGGKGNDEFVLTCDSYALPVSGGELTYYGAEGLDQITTLSDADVTLSNTSLRSADGGSVTYRSGGSISTPERAFLAGRSGSNRIDASGYTIGLTLLGQPPAVTIAGGDGDDTLIGTSRDDLILGGAGDDTILAGNGINIIDGGTGDDWIEGGTGRDLITAGDGDDYVIAGLGDDVIDGGEGSNVLRGNDGNDRITAWSGNDEIFGGTGNDIINAGVGQNYVDGGTGDDVITSGDGDDTLLGGTGNDTIDAGDGNDKIDGGSGNNRLLGGNGDDEILAGAGVDFIDGGEGNDLLMGGAGNDTLRGGAGNDNIQAGDGNDNVDGGTGDDLIDGGTGNDTLLGGDDNDTLTGGTGYDILDGGLGFDIGILGELLISIEG